MGEQGDDDTDGLPELLPIRISIPTSQFHDLKHLTELEGTLVGGMNDTTRLDECSYKTSEQSLFETNVTIDFRIVHNRKARDNSDLSLEAYEEYVSAIRTEYWGYDHGWDRYIDDHIGWYLPVRLDNSNGDDDG